MTFGPARTVVPRGWVPGALLLLGVVLPEAALAHPAVPPEPDGIWGAWNLDPWVLLGVGLPAWIYARGLRALWGRAGVGRGVRRWQAYCFGAGVAALFLVLVSPLDALGAALFSAHMLQHMVLIVVAAPLLALGMPLVPFLWALPPRWRVRVGGWGRGPVVRRTWRVLSRPVGAWVVHALALWLWHVPGLYEATLTSEGVHLLQHLSFFGTALLFWWAAVEMNRRRRASHGLGALFVFTTAVHSSILGALLTFSVVLWYPAYAGRTEPWGLTALEDQQLGGLIMWVPAGVVYLVATLVLLAVGLRHAEREARRTERAWRGAASPEPESGGASPAPRIEWG